MTDLLTVRLSSAVYALETIKKAAYRFSDRLVVEIVPIGDVFECSLRLRPNHAQADIKALASDFEVEVLDQDLRATVAAETGAMRNAILAFAFSNTGLAGD